MMTDVTRILNAIKRGDPKAADELLPLVYEELRLLASQKMAQEKPGQTLQATALVHEAYLRLVGAETPQWDSRNHFFAAASEAMRRILVENARRKKREKHGGGLNRLDITKLDVALSTNDETILLVNEALEKLMRIDPMGAKLIQLRFFTGFPNIQAARILGIPERTAKRAWAYARAWLHEEIQQMLQNSDETEND
jgi:RNA polymerase sigma factor (TIGR02999 family)